MKIFAFTFLTLFSSFTFANTIQETITNTISKSLNRCSHNGITLNNDNGQKVARIYNDGCNAITLTLEISKYEDPNFNEPSAQLVSSKLHKGISLEDILNYKEKKKPSLYAEEGRKIFSNSHNITRTLNEKDFEKIKVFLKENSLSYTLYTNEDLRITQKNYRELQIKTFADIKISQEFTAGDKGALIESSINTLDCILKLGYNTAIDKLLIPR